MNKQKTKSIILLSFCLVSIIIFQSCESKNKRNGIIKDSKLVEKKEYKYERQWLETEYIYPDSILVSKVEVYLTEDSDTIYQQCKFYRNNVLDSTRSTYYKLDLNKKGNNQYYGRIYFHLQSKGQFKNQLIEKNLGLAFLHLAGDTTKIFDFESKNKDYVEFEYTHTSDTLIGMLYQTRLLDTIINGEKKVRIVEIGFPIDNMPKTNNPYIEVFDLYENKYVR